MRIAKSWSLWLLKVVVLLRLRILYFVIGNNLGTLCTKMRSTLLYASVINVHSGTVHCKFQKSLLYRGRGIRNMWFCQENAWSLTLTCIVYLLSKTNHYFYNLKKACCYSNSDIVSTKRDCREIDQAHILLHFYNYINIADRSPFLPQELFKNEVHFSTPNCFFKYSLK
jgi:hypothetical protein